MVAQIIPEVDSLRKAFPEERTRIQQFSGRDYMGN